MGAQSIVTGGSGSPFLGLSDPYGHPNPKLVAGDLRSTSNRVPIRETHFRLSERHNPNTSILSPGNSFAGFVVGENAEYVLNLLPVALPTRRMNLVF